MNAYQIADLLERQLDLPVTVQMLRQQADRIAELEKEAEACWCQGHSEAYLKAKGRLPNQDKSGNSISAEEYQKTHEGFSTIQEVIAKHEAIPSRKEALDKARERYKDVSSKPVAWADLDDWYFLTNTHYGNSEVPDSYIPLYTHPVKQLSDEEIYELWIDAKQTALNTKGGIVELCFARAIIKEITE